MSVDGVGILWGEALMGLLRHSLAFFLVLYSAGLLQPGGVGALPKAQTEGKHFKVTILGFHKGRAKVFVNKGQKGAQKILGLSKRRLWVPCRQEEGVYHGVSWDKSYLLPSR